MQPDIELVDSYRRHSEHAAVFGLIEGKIRELFEGRFITNAEEAQLIEAHVRMAGAKRVLELGMYSGFATLHMIRAVYPDGKVYAIDARPAHDREFFARPEIAQSFEFVEGWTPAVLSKFVGQPPFDLVFVDSDHSLDHCEKERSALFEITRPGTIFIFHDCPQRAAPDHQHDGPIYSWLYDMQDQRKLWRGGIFPSSRRLDCERAFGVGYDNRLSPHLGIFIRA